MENLLPWSLYPKARKSHVLTLMMSKLNCDQISITAATTSGGVSSLLMEKTLTEVMGRNLFSECL